MVGDKPSSPVREPKAQNNESNSSAIKGPAAQPPSRTLSRIPSGRELSTTIYILPTEIWVLIASNLPLASVVALALTSHHMNHQMQHFNIWERIQSSNCSSDKLELLELLEADLPDQMLCHACNQFHRRVLISWDYRDAPPHYRSVSIEGFECQKWKCSFDHFGPRLSGDSPGQAIHWMTCNLVMRAKRYSSKHGLPISRLQHLPDSHRYRRASNGGWNSDHTPFIVGNRLIIRERNFFGLESRPPRKLQDRFTICHHIGPTSFEQDFTTALNSLSCSAPGRYCYTGPVLGCKYCPTVFIVEVRPSWCYMCQAATRARNHTYTLTVTRYINFGACKTPKSREWQALLSKLPYCYYEYFFFDSNLVDYDEFSHALKESRAPHDIFDPEFLSLIDSNHETYAEKLEEVKAEESKAEESNAAEAKAAEAKIVKGKAAEVKICES